MSTSNDKQTLVNTVALLLSCPQHATGLNKLTIPVLEAMYRGLIKNADAWAIVKSEATEAKRSAFISEKRVESLEAEVRKLKAALKKKGV